MQCSMSSQDGMPAWPGDWLMGRPFCKTLCNKKRIAQRRAKLDGGTGSLRFGKWMASWIAVQRWELLSVSDYLSTYIINWWYFGDFFRTSAIMKGDWARNCRLVKKTPTIWPILSQIDSPIKSTRLFCNPRQTKEISLTLWRSHKFR